MKLSNLFISVLMILLTLSSALALTTITVSNVNYDDGPDGTWQKSFVITGISQFSSGEGVILASKLVDTTDGAKATKNLYIDSGISSYTCNYNLVKPQTLYKYYLDEAHGTNMYNCNYFTTAEYRALLPPGDVPVMYVKPTGFSLSSFGCFAVVKSPYITVGDVGLSTPAWESKWNFCSSAKTFTTFDDCALAETEAQTTTVKSTDTLIIVRDNAGNKIAEITNFGAGLASPAKCPEASVDFTKAAQNIGSPTYDLVDGKIVNEALIRDKNFLTDFEQFYYAQKPSLDNIKRQIRNTGQIPMEAVLNSKTSVLYSSSTVSHTITDKGGYKIYDAFAAGEARYPILPMFNLQVQADFVGVIKPKPVPTLEFVDSSVSFISGNAGSASAKVGNVGTTDGNFRVEGTCQNSRISVREQSVNVPKGTTKTINIYFDGATSTTISTLCTVNLIYSSENKATDTITVSAKPMNTCEQGNQNCVNNKIQQCVDNSWSTVEDCGAKTCHDMTNPVTGVTRTRAMCVSGGEDKCTVDEDCKTGDNALEAKPGKAIVCINPIIGFNYCDYKDLNLKVCENGIDDDGDSKVDYPLDKGCESLTDEDETDPTPPWILIISVVGLIGAITFAALSYRAYDDEDHSKLIIFGSLGVISLLLLAWGLIVWIGFLAMLFTIIGITLLTVGPMLGKLIPPLGTILVVIGIILLLIAAIIFAVKIFALTTLFGGGILQILFGQ